MTEESARSFQDDFFSRNPTIRGLIELMSNLKGLSVYAKDRESRYVFNNDSHRIIYDRIAGRELIGKKASDFFPPLLGAAYETNDQQIFSTLRPLQNGMWLVPTIRGTPRWFLSNKAPLFSADKKLIGLIGILSPISTPENQLIHFGELKKVIEFIDSNFVDEVTAEKLAGIAGPSVPQLNRRFRQILRLSPIGKIATETGFYDQSHSQSDSRRLSE